MANTTFIDFIEFITEQCCSCGMPFAMTAEFRRKKLENKGAAFYCPAGHAQHYIGKTEAQKLREQNERLQRNLEAESGRAMMIERERDNVRRQAARMRNRIQNGVCPCCNRTFPNLAAHMRSKHSDFGEPQTFRALRIMFGLTQRAVADEIGVSPSLVSEFERDNYISDSSKTLFSEWVETNAKANA